MQTTVLVLFLAFSKHLMKYTVNARHQVHMFTWNLVCVFFGWERKDMFFAFRYFETGRYLNLTSYHVFVLLQ